MLSLVSEQPIEIGEKLVVRTTDKEDEQIQFMPTETNPAYVLVWTAPPAVPDEGKLVAKPMRRPASVTPLETEVPPRAVLDFKPPNLPNATWLGAETVEGSPLASAPGHTKVQHAETAVERQRPSAIVPGATPEPVQSCGPAWIANRTTNDPIPRRATEPLTDLPDELASATREHRPSEAIGQTAAVPHLFTNIDEAPRVTFRAVRQALPPTERSSPHETYVPAQRTVNAIAPMWDILPLSQSPIAFEARVAETDAVDLSVGVVPMPAREAGIDEPARDIQVLRWLSRTVNPREFVKGDRTLILHPAAEQDPMYWVAATEAAALQLSVPSRSAPRNIAVALPAEPSLPRGGDIALLNSPRFNLPNPPRTASVPELEVAVERVPTAQHQEPPIPEGKVASRPPSGAVALPALHRSAVEPEIRLESQFDGPFPAAQALARAAHTHTTFESFRIQAGEVAVREQPPAAVRGATPARELRVTLQAQESRCEVRLIAKGDAVEIAVRTPDRHLNAELRQQLAELARSVTEQGYRIESWTPHDTAPTSMSSSIAQVVHAGGTEEQQLPDDRSRQHPQHEHRNGRRREQWLDAFENFLRRNA